MDAGWCGSEVAGGDATQIHRLRRLRLQLRRGINDKGPGGFEHGEIGAGDAERDAHDGPTDFEEHVETDWEASLGRDARCHDVRARSD